VIIAIDAASTEIGLALAEPDGSPIAEEAWSSHQRQSAELMPRLLDLLERYRRDLHELTAIAVGTGPGSFTGLRVAMALAKGLAVGLERPIVGIDSLSAWLDASPEAEAALARAGAREAYLLVRGADAPVIADAAEIRERLRTTRVVAASELATAFGLERAVGPRGAGTIASRAAQRLAEDAEGDDVRRIEPAYLRGPRGLQAPAEGKIRWL
jgi:tRNA threonylcarbamoyl adenosine modification protein YeaZ